MGCRGRGNVSPAGDGDFSNERARMAAADCGKEIGGFARDATDVAAGLRAGAGKTVEWSSVAGAGVRAGEGTFGRGGARPRAAGAHLRMRAKIGSEDLHRGDRGTVQGRA